MVIMLFNGYGYIFHSQWPLEHVILLNLSWPWKQICSNQDMLIPNPSVDSDNLLWWTESKKFTLKATWKRFSRHNLSCCVLTFWNKPWLDPIWHNLLVQVRHKKRQWLWHVLIMLSIIKPFPYFYLRKKWKRKVVHHCIINLTSITVQR